jgi:hypothetical protein
MRLQIIKSLADKLSKNDKWKKDAEFFWPENYGRDKLTCSRTDKAS